MDEGFLGRSGMGVNALHPGFLHGAWCSMVSPILSKVRVKYLSSKRRSDRETCVDARFGTIRLGIVVFDSVEMQRPLVEGSSLGCARTSGWTRANC